MRVLVVALIPMAVVLACSSSEHPPVIPQLIPPDASTGDGGPMLTGGGITIPPGDDPTTCAAAAQSRSYVGCDYWPTVVANNVWSIFDYAVVVANAGKQTADVTVTGPGGLQQQQSIAPNALARFYLPWVSALKGADSDACGFAAPLSASVIAKASAYHLVSSVPVIVTQFNALEYAPKGGPAGKDWSACPGNQKCENANSPANGQPIGCFSFTNDSSLLLPTTALTGNYRLVAFPGETETSGTQSVPIMGSYVAVTATHDATHVKLFVAAGGDVMAGTGVTKTLGGGELDLTLDAGDVAELPTDLGAGFDLSGSLLQADQPVQVITGAPCDQVPVGAAACDHLEQSVVPAETLGKDYFIARPTGPTGQPVSQVVRLVGNVDGTTLTYLPSTPKGCPAKLDAGQVVDCGVVASDFEVKGSHEFALATFQLGGSIVDPQGGRGDPSQSVPASVEQYRVKYVFLAPGDYDVSYADVVAPTNASLVLDGAVVQKHATAIADGYGVTRVPLSAGASGGAHELLATAPVGLQVVGYGEYTSYQYPGGLDLKQIAPPPPTQ